MKITQLMVAAPALLALALAGCAPAAPTAGAETQGDPLASAKGEATPSREPSAAPPASTPATAQPEVEYPAAVLAAVQALSKSKAIAASQVEILSFEEVTWRNSCLDLAGPGEMCLQVLTRGYRVMLRADGEEFEFHTDEKGQNVRQKPGGGLAEIKPGLDQSALVIAILRSAPELRAVEAEEIEVISFEEVDWPDSCLGLPDSGEVCLQAITPGYLILLRAGGKEYEIHTDLSGENVRVK